MKKSLFLIIVTIPILFFYQNCAEVPLQKDLPGEEPYYGKGQGEICLSGPYANYTVDSFYVVNLNIGFKEDKLVLDSDADGLSDGDESALGFDPLKRRSSGGILDSLCSSLTGTNSCEVIRPGGCTETPNMLGLTDCDYRSLNLHSLYSHPQQGLDSDKDGIPDLVEILRGTNPNIRDETDDTDRDQILNSNEILRGTNPIYSDRNASVLTRVLASISKTSSTSCAGGEVWKINIDQIPFVRIPEFVDTTDSSNPVGALSLSHAKNENVILIYLKLRPQVGQSGNPMILFKALKINADIPEFVLDVNQFVKAGEVEP